MKKIGQTIWTIVVYILTIGFILSLILGFLYALVKIFDLAENPNADYTLIIAFLTLIIPVWFGTWYSKKLELKNDSAKTITIEKQQFIKKLISLLLNVLNNDNLKGEIENNEVDLIYFLNQQTRKSIKEFENNINKTTFEKAIENLKKEMFK